MIWFFTPYSFEGKLFEAYDRYMNLITDPQDWVVFTDGDALLFHSDFGNMIKDYIEKYPDTGMFVCFANRIGNKDQLYSRNLFEIDSIKYNFLVADNLRREHHGKTTVLNSFASGFLMVIQRRTWSLIRKKAKQLAKEKLLLDVDFIITSIIREKRMAIRRMDGLLMLHYYRFVEGTPQNRGIR